MRSLEEEDLKKNLCKYVSPTKISAVPSSLNHIIVLRFFVSGF
jgi:hypothetical protein